MKGRFRKLIRRIGHRGAFLLFLSLLDFLFGYALTITPMPHSLNHVMSYKIWGVIWLATGVVTLVGAFMKRDRVAFGVASTLKAAWAGQYILVWLYNPLPLAWANVALWVAFSGIIVVISTWPEIRRINEKKLKVPG